MNVSPGNADNIDSYDELSDEALAAWDPEGDFGRRHLLNPTIFRLLGPLAGRRVLDAGCGQGYLSRLLAERGASVVGVDPSARMLAYAQRIERARQQGIRFDRRDLSRLGEPDATFDAVVANMVFLDIADWEAAMSNCVAALRPGGRFVYAELHPCWSPGAADTWAAKGCVELREYLAEYALHPAFGVNFHRPLSTYVNATIRLGCQIEEIVEPGLDVPDATDAAHDVLVHIPNFVVVSATKQ